MNVKPTNPRVGVKYVEQRFGKHRNSIRRWIAAGKFPSPAYDVSGYMSWDVATLDKWEAENYQPTTNFPEKAAHSARGVA